MLMMASACVNAPSPDPAFGWLSPRISFTRESDRNPIAATPLVDPVSEPDFIDFEFRLHDPVAMLHADELFSGGRLVPRHLSKPVPAPPAPLKPSRRDDLIGSGSASDNFSVSPKAPTCTSRWRELLRIRKQQQHTATAGNAKPDPGSRNPSLRSSALKHFLHRRSSSADPNLSKPLLKESEPEALSRLSLSSDENPRFSLDSDPNPNTILLNRNPPRSRASSWRATRSPARRSADAAAAAPLRCSSVDSPRMNASGKVVFQGLGRSSSSPSTFKYKGGMDRTSAYSANVRVINVPVPSNAGSVFGFLGSKNASGGNRGRNHI